ncbi:unnamed protein product [Heligmosomoides polygyrus]|uniref:Uncharacterized protein n=1 Tax=Heligmosomoides polygyrus TaxID=6339 RepID=A0A183GW25_HELPZ|nr:unnamed protein product [Heligmosomoides polygyrus]
MNVEGGEHPDEEHKPNTSIATTTIALEDNASDCNSVKSTTLVDLHACGICFQPMFSVFLTSVFDKKLV